MIEQHFKMTKSTSETFAEAASFCELLLSMQVSRPKSQSSFISEIENSKLSNTWALLSEDVQKLVLKIYKRGEAICNNFSFHNFIPSVQIKTTEWLLQNLNALPPHWFIVVDVGFLKANERFEDIFSKPHFANRLLMLLPSEENKNAKTLTHIIQKLELFAEHVFDTSFDKSIDNVFDKIVEKEKPIVLCIGGGICSDIVGFATGLLGLEFHVVPTTLLSSVDAAIGGKTAINSESRQKNQLGMFHGAKSLTLNPDLFKTCSNRSLLAGTAEVLKHCWLIGDWKSFDELAKNSFDLSSIVKQIEFKVSMVLLDPTEQNERKLLNFGHTFAHVWEALNVNFPQVSGEKLEHGDCVAWGMFAAAHIMQNDFEKSEEDYFQLLRLQNNCLAILEGTHFSSVPVSFLQDIEQRNSSISLALRGDKKNVNKEFVSFVLPRFGIFKEPNRSFLKSIEVNSALNLFLSAQSEFLNAIQRHN